MYTVWMFDDGLYDESLVFSGTLAECLDYVGDDEFEELFIVEPDGITVYEG